MPKPFTIEQINKKKPILSRLTAIKFGENKLTDKTVICKCVCGTVKEVRVRSLLTTTYSCGCYNSELINTLGNSSKYETIEKIMELSLVGNKLIPIRFAENKIMPCGNNYPQIYCKCECGKYKIVSLYHYVANKIKSCGCIVGRQFKYEGNIKEIRASYDSMMRRCYDTDSESYPYYGGRGVKVCDKWRNNYNAFLNWAKTNGWGKGLCIDKDKLGNRLLYSPETCCWLTHAENMKYTRSATLYLYKGEQRTLTEIGKMIGRKGDTLRRNILAGLTLKQAINKRNYQRIK